MSHTTTERSDAEIVAAQRTAAELLKWLYEQMLGGAPVMIVGRHASFEYSVHFADEMATKVAVIREQAKREQMKKDCDYLDKCFGVGCDPSSMIANAYAHDNPESK